METLPPGEPADAALLFDALHHSEAPARGARIDARRLRPGAWLLLGEPSWLHRLSPGAHATRRDLGWTERGLTLRSLRRDLRAAGYDEMRRFFQPTRPYESRVRGFGWQLVRLVAREPLARARRAPVAGCAPTLAPRLDQRALVLDRGGRGVPVGGRAFAQLVAEHLAADEPEHRPPWTP